MLKASTIADLSLVHIQNLDAIANGQANETTLWHVAEAAITWSRVAQVIGAGEPEMLPQLQLVEALLDRYRRTGKIIFTGVEYQLAKDGVQVMDQLAAAVDERTASDAVEWCDRRIAQRQAEWDERRAA